MNMWIDSGIKSFDDIVQGLRIGDNVVWQIDDIHSYQKFVDPFVEQALREKKKVIYMRFGQHSPLIKDKKEVKVYNLDAHGGFESFSREIHTIITKEGKGAYYIFDCLSDLLLVWATDLMIGNFFMVTCPYLFEMDTIAYFAINRNKHSYETIARIRETTQLLIDVYCCENIYYIHPLKVWNRYSPTMFLPHIEDEDKMLPITNSIDASKLFTYISKNIPESTKQTLDYWDSLFVTVDNIIRNDKPNGQHSEMIERLCKIMMTNDTRMSSLLKRFLTLEDFLNIKSRMMGTGFIGGKAVGMLLARKILLSDKEFEWEKYFEPHDSFYIGSDVFYTYIVQNGLWKLWMEQKTEEGFFCVADELIQGFLNGAFPAEIQEHFRHVIDYFGQSPIIVRSSSLLEDSFGSAFAGKYESIFLANQGSPEERFDRFVEAVRKIYSSTMNEDALVYRQQRGLQQKDEQMALLVQRVSGSYYKNYFFPYCAGVGISYNTYVWQKDMDPQAGMLRIVFGLGTRAVDRVENDYPRIVALDFPLRKAHSGPEDTRKYSQREVDLIAVEKDDLITVHLLDLMGEDIGVSLDIIGMPDRESNELLKSHGIGDKQAWILTFDGLLKTEFGMIMKRMLKTLQDIYQYPVDIEFTLNFTKKGTPQINLVQCRPIQTKGLSKKVNVPSDIAKDRILFEIAGNFMGGNISQSIKRIVYIDPKEYSKLTMSERYDIARIIGKINSQIGDRVKTPTMLLGPGRWGTTTPAMGVPVSFHEISNIAVIGEIEFTSGNLIPELSFGTHFFHDLVETGIFYLALFAEKEDSYFSHSMLSKMTNIFDNLVSNSAKYCDVINVYDTSDEELKIISDVMSQRLICYGR
ncbi:MAG: phosphoenolpyruvate synthase [Proteobacteria bacterium]|nr:phosphoenolpyruvate synthase [Pseudomonadota bacterium]